jgi:outer membrane immunogenic protein
MRLLKVVVVAGAALAASPTIAADYSPPPYVPPPVAIVEPASIWTGFYVGLSGGGRWSKVTWTTLSVTPAPGIPPDPTTTPAYFDSSTGTVGGYFGYDWQFAPRWVWGLQADFDWGNGGKRNGGVPGTFGSGVLAPPAAAAFDSSWVTERWDASVRARVGFLVAAPWLIYGTLGVSMQSIEVGASCAGPAAPASWCTNPGPPASLPRYEPTHYARTGFTYGIGTEAALSHSLFARLEYRYTYYGFIDYTFFMDPPTVDDVQTSVKLHTQTIVGGIAYKFN